VIAPQVQSSGVVGLETGKEDKKHKNHTTISKLKNHLIYGMRD
jgi:hypothetical protein